MNCGYVNIGFSVLAILCANNNAQARENCDLAIIGSSLSVVRVETKAQQQSGFMVKWLRETETPVSSNHKPTLNEEIDIFRCSFPGNWIKIAHGQVKAQLGNMVEAEVMASTKPQNPRDSEALSYKLQNLYWQPMPGDAIVAINKKIVAVPTITPKFTFAASDIFETDFNSNILPELSEKGKKLLVESLNTMNFDKFNLSVESFIKLPGNYGKYAQETNYRVSKITQFLIRDLGIPENKIITLSSGNSEFSGGMHYSQTSGDNIVEGIRLKVVAY